MHYSSNSIRLYIVLIVLFSFITINDAKVSLQNLQIFFKSTYDRNDDKVATWTQFCDYFKIMEPDHDFSFDILNEAFTSFDLNKDGSIRLEQFIDMSDVEIHYKPGHKQIHLGLTENQNEMQVMWVSNPEAYSEPVVYYGHFPTKLDQMSKAVTTTYNVGKIGFHGRIYRAVMKDLKPLVRYYYKVGDLKTKTFSQIKYFKGPPGKTQKLDNVRMAVFGDMGTYAPFGHLVSKMLSSQNFANPYDFVFLTGDIAYAGMNGDSFGEIQSIWDLLGEQTSKFAAYTPFMPGVGNHQHYYNYTSYFTRYILPRNKQNQTNLWFSFDYGQVHVISLSSEHPYQKDTEQYNFLEQDLIKARANPNTQWIIVGSHRAFYSSDQTQYNPITPLTQHLQDLLNKYNVDIVQNGHLHDYQRTWPVLKGKAQKQNHNETYYVNPQTPIYVVQGTAGALINEKWVKPAPEWSLKRLLKYGYGQITIKANYLKYDFISLPVGKIVDTWYILKDKVTRDFSEVQQ